MFPISTRIRLGDKPVPCEHKMIASMCLRCNQPGVCEHGVERFDCKHCGFEQEPHGDDGGYRRRRIGVLNGSWQVGRCVLTRCVITHSLYDHSIKGTIGLSTPTSPPSPSPSPSTPNTYAPPHATDLLQA